MEKKNPYAGMIKATKNGTTKHFGPTQWAFLKKADGSHDGWVAEDEPQAEPFIPSELKSNAASENTENVGGNKPDADVSTLGADINKTDEPKKPAAKKKAAKKKAARKKPAAKNPEQAK